MRVKMLQMSEKESQPSPGYSTKMSILCLSQKNQSHLAVIVGNEPVGKAVVLGLTIVELEDNSEHQEDSQLVTRIRPRVGMLGERLKKCRQIGCVGIGGCDIAQASVRRSRLDCISLREMAICSECVTCGNVANPIQVANARREGKCEEGVTL